MAKKIKATLDRRAAINKILEKRGDALVVDRPRLFLLRRGRGRRSSEQLLSVGRHGRGGDDGSRPRAGAAKRQVLVITGDGEMLMGLGALATIGTQGPRNLSIIVIDNELYSETGMQPTHTARGVDLAGMAKAAKFPRTATIYNDAQLKTWVPKLYSPAGSAFVAIKVNDTRYPMAIKLRDGAHIKNRFREALLGNTAFD